MPIVPPLAHSRTAGGPAYLLEWQEITAGVWGAEIAFISWTTSRWSGRRVLVTADDVTPIEGQNYKSVPRYKTHQMRGRQRAPRAD